MRDRKKQEGVSVIRCHFTSKEFFAAAIVTNLFIRPANLPPQRCDRRHRPEPTSISHRSVQIRQRNSAINSDDDFLSIFRYLLSTLSHTASGTNASDRWLLET